jgi:hypothetical protein
MLMGFDQTTMAHMTAALESVCDKLPPNKDTHANRKRIANVMIVFARSGEHTFRDFQNLGRETLREITGREAAPSGSVECRPRAMR